MLTCSTVPSMCVACSIVTLRLDTPVIVIPCASFTVHFSAARGGGALCIYNWSWNLMSVKPCTCTCRWTGQQACVYVNFHSMISFVQGFTFTRHYCVHVDSKIMGYCSESSLRWRRNAERYCCMVCSRLIASTFSAVINVHNAWVHVILVHEVHVYLLKTTPLDRRFGRETALNVSAWVGGKGEGTSTYVVVCVCACACACVCVRACACVHACVCVCVWNQSQWVWRHQ